MLGPGRHLVYSWLWTVMVPVGKPAWRAALAQATAGAIACGLLSLMVSRGSSLFMESIEELKNMTGKWESAVCMVAGLVSGLLLGLDGFMWKESVAVHRIAVSSVPWFLLMLICILRWLYAPHQTKYIYLALFVFGVCFTTHQSLIAAGLGVQVAIAAGNMRLGRDVFFMNFVCFMMYYTYYWVTGQHLSPNIGAKSGLTRHHARGRRARHAAARHLRRHRGPDGRRDARLRRDDRALRAREDRPRQVNGSHLGSMLFLQGLSVSMKLMAGVAMPRSFRKRAFNPLWNHYRCEDGKWIALAMLQPDRYWSDFARAIGKPELTTDARFKDLAARAANGEACVAVIDAAFATKPRAEWLRILREDAGDFIYTVVNGVDDLPEDPQEGTSGDGTRVLPFRSALFAVAQVKGRDGKPIVVQPVSLAYTRLDGIALGRHWRPFYTWFGDMELAPHAWQMAGLGEVEVMVNFHEPVSLADFPDRRALAHHCFKVVYAGVAASNSGRMELLPPPRKAA